MVRQYYEQGTHVLLVATGNSYQGLCNLIHARTHGEDGIYFTYKAVSYTHLDVYKRQSLRNAISDFRRAFEQRSKWLR